jgi:hypothetical protein
LERVWIENEDYNTFVSDAANAIPELAALETEWFVVGSTATVNGLENTGTPLTDFGEPIYRLDGTLFAATNGDFWDGDLVVPLDLTELETVLATRTEVFTGMLHSGEADTVLTLGSANVTFGFSFGLGTNWIRANNFPATQGHHLYAMSAPITVPIPIPEILFYGQSSRGTLYVIDPVAETAFELRSSSVSGSEIQLTPDGSAVLFAERRGPLHSLNPVTGLSTSSLTLVGMPVDTDTLTALEFVGPTLYGAAHLAGSREQVGPGILVTIDSVTGNVTEIGPMTGMIRPTGGMAFHNGVMYAISATEYSDGKLFSVDLASGVATLIAPLTIDEAPTDNVSGLTMWNGTAYAAHCPACSGEPLYTLDLVSGEMTPAFDLGVSMNALTAVPEPTSALQHASALLVLLGLCAAKQRRRVG